MSETGNSDKTVGVGAAEETLHLKRPVEQGTVRQSFSHGRSKAVVVEKVKRRTPGEAAAAVRPAPTMPAAAQHRGPPSPAKPALAGAARPAPTAPPPPKTGVVLPTLTAEQREARARALDRRAQEERRIGFCQEKAGVRRSRGARSPRTRTLQRKRDEELRRAHVRRRLSGGEPAQSPSIPRVAPPTPGVPMSGAFARPPAAEEEEARRVVVRRPALALPPGQKVVVPTPRLAAQASGTVAG